MTNRQAIHPFILSGGSGTRLWPLSRQAYPKQFLPLVGKDSLLQQSCHRVRDKMFSDPTVLCNNSHRFLVAEQLEEAGLGGCDIVLEPVSRNTAPAALVSALVAARKGSENSLVLLMPSDHVIQDLTGFQRSIARAVETALAGHLVTFGIRPDSPETGYGYIETKGDDAPMLDVVRFVEKPDKTTAESYLETGNFFWNAGIFLYTAKAMVAAFEQHAPELLSHCRKALDGAVQDLDFLRLDKTAYGDCNNISLDYAIMEKQSGIKCLPLESDWSDLGAWPALWEIEDKDKDGNVAHGDHLLFDTTNSYLHSTDGILLSVIGMDDIVAVATKDAILIAPKSRAQDVKMVVEKLREDRREEHIYHTRVYRPWGWYEGLGRGKRFQVKCLSVRPGAQLSLQSHYHRAEHWVVVSGTVEVRVNDKTSLLTENESTYIPIGVKHRLGNPGKVSALLVEVQSGAYLGEDDIVRYEDDFNRSHEDG